MTSRRFFLAGLGLVLCLALGLLGFNVAMDEFGLFGVRTGEIRIWGYERASKFLLAQHYVPERFEGLLTGSSSADMMMDTRKLGGYAVYNLAVTGGNICEVKRIVDAALEHGRFRFLVLSLSPYLTKDCHMKTNELDPGLRRSALGSLFTLRFYHSKLKALWHPEADSFRHSQWGFQLETTLPDAQFLRPAANAKGPIPRPTGVEVACDPSAVQALAELLANARARGVRILAYFHPVKRDTYAWLGEIYDQYRGQMLALFTPGDVVWDFNADEYADIHSDPAAFFDGAHLSEQGAAKVMAVIKSKLDAVYSRGVETRHPVAAPDQEFSLP